MSREDRIKMQLERHKKFDEKSKKRKAEKVKYINCPHCKERIEFRKDKTGRIVGTLSGGVIGAGLSFKLGLAGAILSAPIAIPATLVGAGLFSLLGNKFGKDFDNSKPICPKCEKKIIL